MARARRAEALATRRAALGRWDASLFLVSGILFVDQLPATASIGSSAIGWWVVVLALFAVPYAMICVEMGTTWPNRGGIYVWIREAFGPTWAARAIWCYWIQPAIWVPSVAVLAAGVATGLLGLETSLTAKVGLALVFTWSVAGLGCLRTELGKWAPNLGAACKFVVIAGLGAAGVYAAATRGPANDLSPAAMLPSFGAELKFLPILIFNLIGFELVSSAADEMGEPARDLPRAALVAAALVCALYLFATFGMLSSIPADGIELETGIVDTLRRAFGMSTVGLHVAAGAGALLLVTLLTNMTTWAFGINRSMSEAAANGVMPEALGRSHPRWGTPVGATLWMAVLSTATLLAYSLVARSFDELFWTLVSSSTFIFLIPYLVMFAAFLKLRRAQPSRARPFRVPGGPAGALASAGSCATFVAAAMILFVHALGGPVDWRHSLSVLIGAGLAGAAGETVLRRSRRSRGGRRRADVHRGAPGAHGDVALPLSSNGPPATPI